MIPGTNVAVREVRAGTLPAPPRGRQVAQGTLVLLAANQSPAAAGAASPLTQPPLLGAREAAWYTTTCPLPQVVAFYTTVLHQASWAGAFTAAPSSTSGLAIRDGGFQTVTPGGAVAAFIEVARLPEVAASGPSTAVELVSQRLTPGGTSASTNPTTSATADSGAGSGGAPTGAGTSSGGTSASTSSGGTLPGIASPTVAPTAGAPALPATAPTVGAAGVPTVGISAAPTTAPPAAPTASPAMPTTAPVAVPTLPAAPTTAPARATTTGP